MGTRFRLILLVTILFSFSAVTILASPRGNLVSGFYYSQRDELKSNDQSSDGWTFCFEDKCRCKDDLADCSQNLGDLAFIPRLPERVKFVNFSFNSVGKVSDRFFTNVTNITSLDMSDNDLVLIGPNAFRSLRNLTQLFIRNNPGLSYAALDPVFSLSTLQELDVAGGNLGPFPTDFFHRYPLPNLKVWNLHNNNLLLDDLTDFSALNDILSDLDLSYNDIRVMKTDVPLDLQRINIEKNAISQFPQTCKNKTSLLPQLTQLILRRNMIASLAKEICLPALKHLDLGQNSISVLKKDGFSPDFFPVLTELYLDRMSKPKGIIQIKSQAFNNPSLEYLSLSDSNVDFDFVNYVDSNCFQGCSRLTTLLLNNNILSLGDDKTLKIFRTLANVRYLELRNVGITKFDNGTLSELPNLSQLFLSENLISYIPDGAFDGLLNLTTLDLSNCEISTIKETAFSAAARERFQRLDLSGNPFDCSCALRWFQVWRRQNPALFGNSSSTYTCSDIDYRITGADAFYLSEQACLLSPLTYTWIFVAAFYSNCGLFGILYYLQRRFRVRQTIRRALGGGNNNQRLPGIGNYEYDLFVAYAEGDEDWVRGRLTPELEERMGLRLCIHQRDFHPGRHILDNIESSVSVSRKVMMVFSPNFARSDWCQFELTLCQRHVMDRGDFLVVVYLHEVPERDMTPGMMAILRTYTYLQWSEEPGIAAYFWNNLRLALHDVIRH